MTDISSQTLHVVAKELGATMNDARAALEAYSERPDQLDLLEKCADCLHQARGVLRLVEVYGAALLAEEMEQVTRHLIAVDHEKKPQIDGLDALMRAMVQLPTYLERVMSGGRDLALVLLPLLNDLRAVRGSPLLSEGTLLLLNLKSDQPAQPQPARAGEAPLTVTQWARRLRSRFQVGLLGIIRGERVEQNLEILAKVAEKLEQVATTQPVFQLWWVTGAVIEAMRSNGLETSATLKRLLGQADRQIKRLYELGEARYCEDPPIDLLNNLLYYVARASNTGGRVGAVRASFKLTELLPVDEAVEQERESLSAPSVKLMHTVAAAIKEDLSKVKDVLDIFVRRGGGHVDELAPQLELLKKISDTLGVLGLGELRERVQSETESLSEWVTKAQTPPEDNLLRMAATLLSVEDSLDDQLVRLILPTASTGAVAPAGDDVDFRAVTEAVLRECIVNLARIKEAISIAVHKPGEFAPQGLDNVPQLLRGITAGLLMLGKGRAVEIMDAIGTHVRALLEPGSPAPEPARVERIADAIVSIEYYMETLQSGRNDPWYMLDNAEMCIQALDSDSARIPAIGAVTPGVATPGAAPADLAKTTKLDGPRPALFDVGATVKLDGELPSTLTTGTQTEVATPAAFAATLVIPPPEGAAATGTAAAEAAAAEAAAPGATTPGGAKPAAAAGVAPAEAIPVIVKTDLDPELLELFIEEAKEEIVSIQKVFPQWDENPMDTDALVTLRRSFHTLKGSGRMVGARLIGEFAWSIENLLNRILDKTRTRSPGLMSVVRGAVAELPHLIEQLESGRPLATPVDGLMARAFAYAQGEEPEPAGEDRSVRVSALAPGAAVPGVAAPGVVTPGVATPGVATPEVTAAGAVTPGDAASGVATPGLTASAAAEPPAAIEPAHAPMDPVLHDIYSKETEGHLSVIREYLRKRGGQPAPHDLPENVYRAIHTLSGSSKMAEARHGIRITEPLNLYIRKVFESGRGLSDSGLAALADSVRAIEQVVEHINEATNFFGEQPLLVERLRKLEAQLDAQLAQEAEAANASALMPAPFAGESLPETEAASFESHEPAAPPSAESAEPPVAAEPATASSAESAEATFPAEPAAMGFAPEPVQEFAAEAAEPSHIAPAASVAPSAAEPMAEQGAGEEGAGEQAAREFAAVAHPAHAPETGEQTLPSAAIEHAADEQAGAAREGAEAGMPEQSAAGEAAQESAPAPAAASELTQVPADGAPPIHAAIPATETQPAPRAAETPAPTPPTAGGEEFDPEIAAIYCEEATELLEGAENALAAWNLDRADKAPFAALQRQLHTLKGGARMAGITAMGNLSHELETLVVQIDVGAVPADEAAAEVLQASVDELARMRDQVSKPERVMPATQLIERIHSLLDGNEAHAEPSLPPRPAAPAAAAAAAMGSAAVASRASVFTAALSPAATSTPGVATPGVPSAAPAAAPFVEPPPSDRASLHASIPPADARPLPRAAERADALETSMAPMELSAAPVLPGREALPQERTEMARVDAELLDTMLNNAGEVSIFRARLDQQVSSIDFNLAELARTVTRLKEQLRALEIETEAQVLHRHQEAQPRHSDFDPLELDRYSALQQYSRALAETSSDVASIQSLLESLTREAQNLLTQQSRVITELQNGLMRTRMVPFQRHVQRLTRLVRQAANDTGKRAELAVEGAAAELDRQVLERMVPPLEHLLRNAVVHGIEPPTRRAAAGKPEVGRISVSLERDGAEVVIIVADDGGGIDVRAIRDKAISLGLADPSRKLTDEEAMQLILEPGFSTAGHVTQAAGRGVGMDVVATEVKKLGGGLFIESNPGRGTRFTIRLPFTLAISQALIVRVADEVYALPLATVEGVVRLPRNIVARHLAKDAPLFDYGAQKYRFQQLGTFVGLGPTRLPDTDASLSVVLIRAGEHSTALVADELIGSREIVVKSVGPQISAIRGIAGATILGDGRVVVILDMGALVRSEWRGRPTETVVLEQRDRRTFALVVDDSITVRRVTQRLLERNGMRVVTAKDGVDALSVLQEHLPDIILLDIEMPRMDGYEVAAHVRNDPRLKDIPIVMITSRVSEKHRARAIELGVNDYLGKPYQENQLLDAMEPLVNRRRAQLQHQG